jgi:hypothetical protein
LAGKLHDKVAVIRDGNGGIGLAQPASSGPMVGRSSSSASYQTLTKTAAVVGSDTLAVQGDVRKLCDIDRLFDEAERNSARSTYGSRMHFMPELRHQIPIEAPRRRSTRPFRRKRSAELVDRLYER